MVTHNSSLSIDPAERPTETIQTQSPLHLAFGYYSYYLLKEKYKGFVKYDMDHPAYFAKRDAILEAVNDPTF